MKYLTNSCLLSLAALLTLACGSGNNSTSLGNDPSGRQLQSITISQTANGQQVQFVATGTFSAPPKTVTPLPVMWGLQLYAPPPGNLDYTLTTQPYVFNCATMGSEAGPVSAIAPSNPSAPMSGSSPFSQMTLAYATVKCQ
jgi:hypothetical protein